MQKGDDQEMQEHPQKVAEKRELRRQILQHRQQLGQPAQEAKSTHICRHFLSWLKANPIGPGRVVALYSAIQGEANIMPLVQELASLGVSAALPRTQSTDRSMAFHLVRPRDNLIAGSFGILEPSVYSPVVKPDDIDVFLVPGIAFTESGARLGYGGGYYDRWFAGRAQGAIRMGVAYETQVVPVLPVEPHDWVMHYILTEEGVRACR